MSYDKIKTKTALVDPIRSMYIKQLKSIASLSIKFIQQLGLKTFFGSNIHEIL